MTPETSPPIPVTVLTGFLGAGKTTLLNGLLAQAGGERIAIVENEFGAAGIDQALVDAEPARIVTLADGCICCSVRGELTAALRALLRRREAGELAFDRLLIETTGLADPAPVAQTFFVEDELREGYRLDAILTLVDARHAMRQLDEHRVAVAQVGFADRLLLSKTDLVDVASQALLVERLRRINARAPLLEVERGRVARADVLDLGAFDLDDTPPVPPVPTSLRLATAPLPALGQRSWDDAIGSLLLEHAGELDLDRVGAFVERLIESHGNDMLRYKGILAIVGEPRRLIFQGVHRVAGFEYGSVWRPDEPRTSRVILIGRALPREALEHGFATCAAVHA